MCKSDYCEWVAGIGGLQKCAVVTLFTVAVDLDDISLQKYGELITYYMLIIGCPIGVWAKCQKFTRRKSCFGG